MSKLPVLSGGKCIKILGVRKLDRGMVRAIIRQAGLSVSEFIKLL